MIEKLSKGLGCKVTAYSTRSVFCRDAATMTERLREVVSGVTLDDGTVISPSASDPLWLEVERTCVHFGETFDHAYPNASYEDAVRMWKERDRLPLAIREGKQGDLVRNDRANS